MASKVALFGASGKMGTRISDKLREAFDYELLPVEMGGVCVGATAPARF